MAITMPTMNADDVVKAARAVHEYRRECAATTNAAYNHPMAYRNYEWDKLPKSEQDYTMGMAVAAFQALGYTVRLT